MSKPRGQRVNAQRRDGDSAPSRQTPAEPAQGVGDEAIVTDGAEPAKAQAGNTVVWKASEPGLLTDVEAAIHLRLVEDGADAEAARRRINRLVDQQKIRPCMVGGKRRYSRRELDRFIDDETDRYGETR